jgi:hypothetical protein
LCSWLAWVDDLLPFLKGWQRRQGFIHAFSPVALVVDSTNTALAFKGSRLPRRAAAFSRC